MHTGGTPEVHRMHKGFSGVTSGVHPVHLPVYTLRKTLTPGVGNG